MVRLRVKEIALQQGFNMSSLSRRSDVSFHTIKRIWKDPHHDTSTWILEKLARALNVSIGELLVEEPDDEPK
jgi:DNA-binding Xre family transcriptional regulator